jgi:hypothetical protein
MSLNVFGTKPQDAIYLSAQPFQVRLNCQAGQIALSETEFLGNEAEISIIKAAMYFGTLGKTRNVEWLQLFYVPAPSCTILPSHTVCVSYIKTRSLTAFHQLITKLIGSGVNPAEGIFKLSFERHSSSDRNYCSVRFDWRERQTEKEQQQLQMLEAFMQDEPLLVDFNGTRQMIGVDQLSSLLVQELVDTAKENPDLSPHELLAVLTATEPQPEPVAALPATNGRKRK